MHDVLAVFEGNYGVTADRSMTGTVKELVKDIQFLLPHHGGAASPELVTLNHDLNPAEQSTV